MKETQVVAEQSAPGVPSQETASGAQRHVSSEPENSVRQQELV